MAEEMSVPAMQPVSMGPPMKEESRTNVGRGERTASVAGGALLALYGLTHPSAKGLGLAALGGALLYRGTSGHCPVYGALGMDTAEGHLREVHIVEAVTIDRPREELYRAWRDLEKLPTFMRHIESVRVMDDRLSRWTARVPRSERTVEWEAEIWEERPGELISWRSLPHADVENAGTVEFKDGPDGQTEVQVTIDYRPHPGMAGAAARLMNPVFSQMVKEDVRRFKSLMEAGEVPTVEGQPTGSSSAVH